MKVFFYGCMRGVKGLDGEIRYDVPLGHDLYGITDQEWTRDAPPDLTKASLDGVFAPSDQSVQGAAKLTQIGGWTVLSFWDRSGDHRGNSVAAFVFDEIVIDGNRAIIEADRNWPLLWERFFRAGIIVEVTEHVAHS